MDMDNMNIQNKALALSIADEIDSVISNLRNSLDDLNERIKNDIPNKINTEWAMRIKENWSTKVADSIINTLEEMKVSSSNIRETVEVVESYSNNDNGSAV